MRRYVIPSISILFGMFFVLLPFIGSKSENPQDHSGALNGISLVFGLIVVAISVWGLVNGIRSR